MHTFLWEQDNAILFLILPVVLQMLKVRVRAYKKSQSILLAQVYLPRKWYREREKNQFGRHTWMFPYRDSCRKTKYYTHENLRGCKIECGVSKGGTDLIILAVWMVPVRTGGSVCWASGCRAGGRELDCGRTITQGLKITQEKVLPLQLHQHMVRLSSLLG